MLLHLAAFAACVLASSLWGNESQIQFTEVHVPDGVNHSRYASSEGFAFNLPDAYIVLKNGVGEGKGMQIYWSPLEREHWQVLTGESRIPIEYKIMIARSNVPIHDLNNRAALRRAKQPYAILQVTRSRSKSFQYSESSTTVSVQTRPLDEVAPIVVCAALLLAIIIGSNW